MREATVSVIIPVYKTEQYLAECVQSVLEQDYPHMEIVLVDDGSPDHCPALCDQYAEQYEHISVIHQANSGLGSARNAGVDASSGEYILFVDSDDCLDGRQAVRMMVECAKEKKADIVVGGFRRFTEHSVSEVNRHHLREGAYTGTVDFRFKGFCMYGHLSYDWGKLYRRSFLEKNDLKCCRYPFTQDKAHNMACCVCEPVYAFLEESVCRYRVNEGSVTFRYKENLMQVWIQIAADFHAFLKERGIKKDYGDLIAFHIFFGSFFLAKQELQFKKHGIWEAARALSRYGKNPLVKKAIRSLAGGRYLREIEVFSWKIVIRGASILFSAHLYFLLAFGIAMIRGFKVDERITRSRYKRQK
ncbi:MAG: glycosyltransferase [Candidatus Gastranaerophilales bacterium]|nr:glycosyltransferase [Candidatus Gastranaerophilales bacterium]